jgi:hypothetical protein
LTENEDAESRGGHQEALPSVFRLAMARAALTVCVEVDVTLDVCVCEEVTVAVDVAVAEDVAVADDVAVGVDVEVAEGVACLQNGT